MKEISLPSNFIETEQGNNWFTDGLNHLFLSEVLPEVWLMIEISSQQYPGFFVGFINQDKEAIVQTVKERADGFFVRECSLPIRTEGSDIKIVVGGGND
jgi:hypothetical protein